MLGVWALLVSVFAAQFYLLGVDWPMRMTWKDAFARALTEWSPWLALAPPVVWLAGRFRIGRGRWAFALLPHLVACGVVALVYQGLSDILGIVIWTVRMESSATADGRVEGPAVVIPGIAGRMPFLPVFQEPVTSSVAVPAEGFVEGSTASASGIILPAQVAGPFPDPAAVMVPGPPPAPPSIIELFLRVAAIRAQYTIPIYWVIVGLTWVAGYYRQLREGERQTLELETRLTQANLQTLRSQLQPHFLFNTLNAIAALVHKRPDAAENMVVTLSDFLRRTLDASNAHEVPLRREIELLELYLEIQQTRFGDRLRVVNLIEPETVEAIVPTLLLQPLVENSVRHGLEPRAGGGTITLRAARHGDTLRLEVGDDGIGFQSQSLTAPGGGIGLANTKARLETLYGPNHRFDITANPDGGLTVIVDIPWHTTPAVSS